MRRCLVCISVIIVLILSLLTSCSKNKDVMITTEFSEQLLTLEESILRSNSAIIGEYIDTIQHDNYIEHIFKVKEWLYGQTEEDEIYLYSNIGTGHISDINYSYQSDEQVYEKGKEYVLIMECFTSLMYDHNRYMLNADLLLNETDKEYSMYSRPIDIPDGVLLKDYIYDVYNTIPHQKDIHMDVIYDNEYDEMIEKSDYIGKVTILGLELEGRVHNGNTYKCRVESLVKGDSINKYDDGSVLIVLLKDRVSVGESYIIGFNKIDEESLIYTQSTKTGVYNYQDEKYEEFKKTIE